MRAAAYTTTAAASPTPPTPPSHSNPWRGDVASTLFAIGLIGAAFLAASILPLSTAYSVRGTRGGRRRRPPHRQTFYLTYGIVTMIGAFIVLTPNAPLVAILVGTQVLNAVLLIPLLFAMVGIGRDRVDGPLRHRPQLVGRLRGHDRGGGAVRAHPRCHHHPPVDVGRIGG